MTAADIALILSRHGQTRLAEALGLSTAEISRKLTDKPDHGWTLEQLAAALDFVGAEIALPDDSTVKIQRDELYSLHLVAARYHEKWLKDIGKPKE